MINDDIMKPLQKNVEAFVISKSLQFARVFALEIMKCKP